jgi:hypothetical protein
VATMTCARWSGREGLRRRGCCPSPLWSLYSKSELSVFGYFTYALLFY